MNETPELCFRFPAVARKKVTAAFDGGRIASDGGVMLLSQADGELRHASNSKRHRNRARPSDNRGQYCGLKTAAIAS